MEANRQQKRQREENICIQIFTVSSAMVGACLTVIGLIRVVIALGKADTLADDLLAADALTFLVSCLASYAALRARGAEPCAGSSGSQTAYSSWRCSLWWVFARFLPTRSQRQPIPDYRGNGCSKLASA